MNPAPSHQAQGLQPCDTANTPWLCVAGAKGGVGKTTIATNLALITAKAGYRTLLVDLDPGTGNVGVQLRLTGEYDVDDVAAGRCSIAEAILDGPGRIRVLLGSSGPTELLATDPQALTNLLRMLRNASRDFDIVLFDTGAGLNPITLALAELADLTLGITTPEVTALTDTYALCKVLSQRGTALPRLIVNRTRSREEAMETARKLTTITDRFLGMRSELCGWIHDDPNIAGSTRRQQPLGLATGAAAATSLEDLRSVASAALAELPAKKRSIARLEQTRTVQLRRAT